MKTIKELRGNLDLKIEETSSTFRYFRKTNIDWDVYLPTKQINLQRDFVWTLEQKRELIFSLLIGRHIPHCAVINIIDQNDDRKDINQIIDGKQRLSTIFSFLDDKFTIVIDDEEYLFSELPNEYKQVFNTTYFRYYLVNEQHNKPITDDQKIQWFKFINFSGTPQDKEHINKLSK